MNHLDRDLARRVLAGREDAFDEFFERYFAGLFRFASARLGGDPDAAEEVVQATLCRAIARLGTYRAEAALFTWLCTFCRHEVSAWYRRNRRPEVPIDLLEDAAELRAALESTGTVPEDPETACVRAETGRLVRVVLDHLPARYGDALEWKYLDGLTVREIAGRLRLSPKAAESLLGRAREAFRDAFHTIARERPGDVRPTGLEPR